MSSKKKSAAPETKECAQCLAPDGHHGVTLKPCAKCLATFYCGRACQAAHWKAGHKQHCVTPEERVPAAVPPGSTTEDDPGSDLECAICLEPLNASSTCNLPCTHAFHGACIEGMRKFGLQQACPL